MFRSVVVFVRSSLIVKLGKFEGRGVGSVGYFFVLLGLDIWFGL